MLSFTRPNIVSVRLGGTHFSYLISQFGVACGFYSDDEIETQEYAASLMAIPEDIDPHAIWTSLTVDASPYEPTMSKSTHLRSPALRYLHYFIVYSVSGWRESTGVVMQWDLFCLWCITKGHHCNLADLLLTYYDQMARKR